MSTASGCKYVPKTDTEHNFFTSHTHNYQLTDSENLNILASFLSLLQFNHQNKLNILVEYSQ